MKKIKFAFFLLLGIMIIGIVISPVEGVTAPIIESACLEKIYHKTDSVEKTVWGVKCGDPDTEANVCAGLRTGDWCNLDKIAFLKCPTECPLSFTSPYKVNPSCKTVFRNKMINGDEVMEEGAKVSCSGSCKYSCVPSVKLPF